MLKRQSIFPRMFHPFYQPSMVAPSIRLAALSILFTSVAVVLTQTAHCAPSPLAAANELQHMVAGFDGYASALDSAQITPVAGPRAGEEVADPAAVPLGLRELSAEQLAKVGIRYDTASIAYVEEGLRFNVRTTGINITGSNGLADGRTPRHITLYKQGVNVASWKRSHPNDDVDRLEGILVRLNDPSALPQHREAVVVIWVVPPDAPPTRSAAVVSDTTALDDVPDTDDRTTPSIVRTSIRPNPVSGSTAILTIDVKRPGYASVAIHDMLGAKAQTVAEQTPLYAGEQDITMYNLHDLPQGMYLVVVDIHETRERQVRRMLIER